jgi:hypothetical protein
MWGYMINFSILGGARAPAGPLLSPPLAVADVLLPSTPILCRAVDASALWKFSKIAVPRVRFKEIFRHHYQ